MSLLPFLHRIADGEHLSCEEAREAMHVILAGGASAAQTGAFLIAMRMKGETVAELVGFARAMRDMAAPLDARVDGEPLLDTCGTGGDGLSTFNISTVAAFVAAGAGVRVAKHGNRSISGRCGSADLLETLGVRLPMSAAECALAIRQIGIGFLFAPAMHTAMKHAQPVRMDLKMRTVFNLLGPLTNPAGATAQLVGASSPIAAELMAGALAALGLERGFVVHGSDGLDEITTTGPTLAFEIDRGLVSKRMLTPEDFGTDLVPLAALEGGDRDQNCAIARAVLKGTPGPQREVVLVNASAALVAAGKAGDFREAMKMARLAIDSGAALDKAEQLVHFSHGRPA